MSNEVEQSFTPITDETLQAIIKRPGSAYSNEVRDMALELQQRRNIEKPMEWFNFGT